ncbi:MAG: type III-B CRISPR module RAMP protein Cmr6 [Anaerolinea sp.]|nr:type III-B CRISPR module RAMP protein Cmr6 [Anaerolinea sp.]
MRWTWQRSRGLNAALDACVSNPSHPGLLLDRFVPEEAFGTGKRDWLAAVARSGLNTELLDAQRERWFETVEAPRFNSVLVLQLQTASRLVVGLGAEHALETAITLDRSSGMPIIPGSALKGVARTYALIKIAQQLPFRDEQIETALNTLDNWLSAETLKRATLNDYGLRELDDERREKLFDLIKLFRLIFGYVGVAGCIIFFHGIYAGDGNPFEVDVMTPHFSSYYTTAANRPAPSDDQNPVPVPYLVVKPRQKFWFAIGIRQAQDVELAGVALDYLKHGLTIYGVGAKTAQGYGLFRDISQGRK